jgi:flagellar M-ring protein FliF
MSNVLNNLRQVWQQASLTHKLTLAGIVVAFIGVTIPLLYWSSRPNYALLYGNLAQEDAAKIAEKLRDENVPHELRSGGTSVYVPVEKVYELRLKMVSEGLPTGGSEGYQILDNGELGMSPFKERIQYIRAIEGELVKTIKLIKDVHSARVHVVNEERSIFTRGNKEASATVVIKTRGGGPMQPAGVSAITSLVAGAVKGVTANNVVVVVNGQLESGRKQDDVMHMTGTLFEQKMKIEQYLAEKAENQLEMVLGPNQASVTVDASLSTASIQRTTRTLDPKNRVEAKSLTKKKEEKGTTTGRGNNAPSGSRKDQTEEIEYDTSSTVEQRVDRPGKIDKIAVAVFVNSSALTPEGGPGEEAPPPAGGNAPSNTLTVKEIEDAVGKAVGLKNNDSIKVVVTPFRQVASQTMVDEPGGLGLMKILGSVLQYSKDFSLGVVALAMLVALRMVRGKKPKVQTGAVGEGQAGGEGGGGADPKKRASARQLKGEDRVLRQKITTALQSDPDQVKQLFLSWVESGGGK